MEIYILIIAIQGFSIQGGVTTAEFNTLSDCQNAIYEAEKKWRVEAICVPQG